MGVGRRGPYFLPSSVGIGTDGGEVLRERKAVSKLSYRSFAQEVRGETANILGAGWKKKKKQWEFEIGFCIRVREKQEGERGTLRKAIGIRRRHDKHAAEPIPMLPKGPYRGRKGVLGNFCTQK